MYIGDVGSILIITIHSLNYFKNTALSVKIKKIIGGTFGYS